MKKILFLLMFMLFIGPVYAGSFSASASSTNVSVGSSVTITVRANDAAGKFSVKSNNSGVLAFNDGADTLYIDNTSTTFKFIAKSEGSATITISPLDCAGYDEKEITGNKTITINVKGTSAGKAKSSINYLSSLSIDGAELSPAFNKNTTEYEVTLPNGTSSVNIGGTKESSVSTISGLGSIPVSDGTNYVSVVVTAENGAKKTYNIKVNVLELEPILVNIDNEDMTFIRKAEAMPSVSDYYTLGTVDVSSNTVPAYINEATGFKLVALKDDTGNSKLYQYDDGKLSIYQEYGFDSVMISLLEPSMIPSGYTLSSLVIGENEVPAYVKDNCYPLIYGVNLETGEKSFYSYDSSENTIQKYLEPVIVKDYDLYIMIGMALICFIQFIIILLMAFKKNNPNKKSEINKKTDIKDNDIGVEDIKNDDSLADTAVISNSVDNVFDASIDKKKKKKNKDSDDMYRF